MSPAVKLISRINEFLTPQRTAVSLSIAEWRLIEFEFGRLEAQNELLKKSLWITSDEIINTKL